MSMIQGKAYWAKVTGTPAQGYKNMYRHWSLDVSVDQDTKKELIELGLEPRLKNKGDDRGDFISFSRKEFKRDGVTLNAPIPIIDHHGEQWNGQLIGNGSTVNVLFNVNPIPGGDPRADILKMQVWDYVPYEGRSEFPTRQDSPAEKWVASNDVHVEPLEEKTTKKKTTVEPVFEEDEVV